MLPQNILSPGPVILLDILVLLLRGDLLSVDPLGVGEQLLCLLGETPGELPGSLPAARPFPK